MSNDKHPNFTRFANNVLADTVYAGGLICASPILLGMMARQGKLKTDWPGRFGLGKRLPPKKSPRLLIHAVSVGETNAIRPLVSQLEKAGVECVISSTTNTGYARAVKQYGIDKCVRFPIDFSCSVQHLIERVSPDTVALVELELWPNFIRACQARDIPICVVNGRLSERSFKGYHRMKPLISGMFKQLCWAGVQTEEYAQRFIAMGMPPERVNVTNSLKWDFANPSLAEENQRAVNAQKLSQTLKLDRNRPTLVIGSSGPCEEKTLLEQFKKAALSQDGRKLQIIIAPRKPERFDEVRQVVKAIDPMATVRSEIPQDHSAKVQLDRWVMLLDTIGELEAAYELADFVFLGRSLACARLYGSDPIQPVAMEKATMIGPRYADFLDIVKTFHPSHEYAGLVITEDPVNQVKAWLENPDEARKIAANGLKIIQEHQGATELTSKRLQSLLSAQRD